MGLSDSPKAKAKSNEVVASIQALLGEFSTGEPVVGTVPAQVPVGEVKVQEAQDLIELPTVEQVTEEHKAPVIEEHLKEAANEVVAEQESLPQLTEATEEPVLESAGPKSDEEDKDDEDDEDDEDEDE
jgi:hypothetical protein